MPTPPNHSDTFSRIIASYGMVRYEAGRHDIADLEASKLALLRPIAESIINRLRILPGGALMPHINFEYVDEPYANAFAFFDAPTNTGHIGVCTGLVFILYDLFYRILSHPGALSKIGDAKRENPREPFHAQGVSQDYKSLIDGRGLARSGLSDVIPNDNARIQFAEYLTAYAFDYLIAHEVCHLRHGHCHLGDEKGISLISELNLNGQSMGLSVDQSMMLQAFEFDADAYAINHTFKRHCNFTEGDQARIMIRVLSDSTDYGNVVKIAELFGFDISFSTQAMFWMFGLNFDPNAIESYTHPPAPLRSFNNALMIHTILELHGTPGSADAFSRINALAFGSVKTAMSLLQNGTIPPELGGVILKSMTGGVYSDHNKRLKEKWTEIRPALLRHSYVQGLAP
jgi:hypothetical protein